MLTQLTPSSAPAEMIPWLGSATMSLGASLFSGGIWPCVPLLVDEAHMGVAFGFMTALQNAALSVVLIGAGALQDGTGSYYWVGTALACLGLCSTLLGGVLLCHLWTQWRPKASNPNTTQSFAGLLA